MYTHINTASFQVYTLNYNFKSNCVRAFHGGQARLATSSGHDVGAHESEILLQEASPSSLGGRDDVRTSAPPARGSDRLLSLVHFHYNSCKIVRTPIVALPAQDFIKLIDFPELSDAGDHLPVYSAHRRSDAHSHRTRTSDRFGSHMEGH